MTIAETVTIDRMSYGSAGIGRLSTGKTVFVDKVAPGDVCRVAITEERPHYAKAELIELLEPSSHRAQKIPACTHSCGGCPWAQIDPDEQLRQKHDAVREALVRVGKLDRAQAEALVLPCVAAPHPWGYRNKIELGVMLGKNERMLIGFHEEGSADLAPIDACPAAVEPLQKMPRALRGALGYLAGSTRAQNGASLGSLHRIGARASLRTRSLEVALWTAPGPFPRAHAAKVLSDAARPTSLVRVLADEGSARAVKKLEVLSGAGFWRERLLGTRFAVSAPSFFQVNTEQAERLVKEAVDGFEIEPRARVADLYAGVGTFSLALAQRGASVLAIEMEGSSVRNLRSNVEGEDVTVIGGDAAREAASLRNLEAIVIDPPRSGLSPQAVRAICEAMPKRIAYVSCNPQTWARDTERLLANGWRLTRVVPVDLFPQTYHIEIVSHFVRV